MAREEIFPTVKGKKWHKIRIRLSTPVVGDILKGVCKRKNSPKVNMVHQPDLAFDAYRQSFIATAEQKHYPGCFANLIFLAIFISTLCL